MNDIIGKTIIFTDLHCGLSGNKISRLNICVKVVKNIIKYAKDNDVKNIIFGGDWFHSRSMLDNNTINIALKLVHGLAKNCAVYLIVGNHDAYFKDSIDVNSLNMFRQEKNVIIIDNAEECLINNKKCLLVPWLTDLTKYNAEQFDIMIGHFEISSKYLMQAYIEEHKSAVKASVNSLKQICSISEKTASLIGSFVDLVKQGGTIYAGHIHKHQEFTVRNRNFVFIGSPYQQTMGEEGNTCGFYVLDESCKNEFIEFHDIPRHIRVPVSNMVKDDFDFSIIHGNVFQKIYDVDIDRQTEIKLQQKINDFKPYEELLPDYQVEIKYQQNDGNQNFSIDAIRKSKLDYIRNYIDNMDGQILTESNIDKDKLFDILKKYYENSKD